MLCKCRAEGLADISTPVLLSGPKEVFVLPGRSLVAKMESMRREDVGKVASGNLGCDRDVKLGFLRQPLDPESEGSVIRALDLDWVFMWAQVRKVFLIHSVHC